MKIEKKTISKFNKKINHYYEHKEKKISKILDLNDNFQCLTYTDNNGNHILELIKNDKLILKAEYQLIGFYNIINSLWYWGWGIDMVDRSLVKDVEKIKTFPNYIKNNMNIFDHKEVEKLHFRTENSSFFMDIKKVIELIKLAIYYLNVEWYATVCYGRDGTKSTCKILSETENKKSKDNILRFEYLLIKKILTIG
jgi:hypothetical protein